MGGNVKQNTSARERPTTSLKLPGPVSLPTSRHDLPGAGDRTVMDAADGAHTTIPTPPIVDSRHPMASAIAMAPTINPSYPPIRLPRIPIGEGCGSSSLFATRV
jgi:hypothetical protein